MPAYLDTQKQKFYIKQQTSFSNPAAGDAVQLLSEGATMNFDRELIPDTMQTEGIGQKKSRPGIKAFDASIPTQFRANSTLYGKPEYDILLQNQGWSTLRANETTDLTAKSTANSTAGKLNTASSTDTAKIKVNDIIVIKETNANGGWVVTPVTAIDTTNNNLTCLIPRKNSSGTGVAFSASVKYNKLHNYQVSDTAPTAVSVTKIIDKKLFQYGTGCIGSGLTIDNITPGTIPNLTFAVTGLKGDQKSETSSLSPSFSTAVPPIALDVTLYKDGSEYICNEFNLDVAIDIGAVTTINSPDGKVEIRQTNRVVTGNVYPYLDKDSVANWNNYNSYDDFGLFFFAKNAGSSAGTFKEGVCIWLPSVSFSGYANSDSDGIFREDLPFSTAAPSGFSGEAFFGFL